MTHLILLPDIPALLISMVSLTQTALHKMTALTIVFSRPSNVNM